MAEQEQSNLQTVQLVYKKENPGSTLGIIGFILSLTICPPAAIVLGIISRNKSQKAKQSTTWGTASFVMGAIFTMFWIIGIALASSLGFFTIKTMQNSNVQIQTQTQSEVEAQNSCINRNGLWKDGKCVDRRTQQPLDCDPNRGLSNAGHCY